MVLIKQFEQYNTNYPQMQIVLTITHMHMSVHIVNSFYMTGHVHSRAHV